jgi:WD40 repeat protein
MPRETTQNSELSQATLSRRSLLLSTVVGGVGISALDRQLFPGRVLADEPAAASNSPLRAAVGRIEPPTENEVVRLKPISDDYDRTVVRAIASDPRGEILAVAGDDHAIRILMADTMEVVETLVAHRDLVRTLAFSDSGTRLVSAGNDGQLILWDRERDFRKIETLPGTPALACVRFSPEGDQLAAVGFAGTVFLIGRKYASGPSMIACPCNDLRAVAYRDDRGLIATAGRCGKLFLYDRATNESLGSFEIHRGRVHALEFPTSRPVVVSVGEDGFVTLFDTEAKVVVRRIAVTSSKLFSVAIVDQQRIAVAGSDNIIRVVDVRVGKVVDQLHGHNGSIAALATDETLLYSGSYDATLRRWVIDREETRDRIAERDPQLDR